MNKEGSKPQPGATPTQQELEAKAAQQRKDYIGCLMSVISKQEIRYVGTLVMINSKEQTLVLQNVKSYGSEGRRGGGPDEVPASSQIYEHIIFRAAELKDFYVIKSPEKDFKDPAILSKEERPAEPKEEKKQIPVPVEPAPAFTYDAPEPYVPRRGRGGYQPRYQRSRASPRRFEGSYYERPERETQEKYSPEFDFEAMNKKFESLFKETEAKIEVGVKYDKAKSFYDKISRGTDEKTESPFDPLKQREINATTFDLDPEAYNRGGYYPRYYGGQGYRGRSSRRGEYMGRGQQTRGRRGQTYYRRKM